MKLLRFLTLIVAIAIVPVVQMKAMGQQEVDPEHFDQSTAKVVGHQAASPKHHHQDHHTKLASKHKSGKSHHQKAHAVG